MENVPLNNELKTAFYSFMETDERITSLHTLKSYKLIANIIFEKYDSISRESVRDMIKKYGKKTKVKAMLTKLNEFFLEYDIDYNIRFRKGKKPERKIPDIISKKELKTILDTMPKVYRMMVSCIYNIGAGLRISELINLEWNDIRWEQLTLDTPIIEVLIKNSKRGKSRIVPMPKESVISLIDYADEIGVIGSSNYPEGGRIFDFGEDSFKKDLRVVDERQWEWEYVGHAYNWIRHNIFHKYFKPIVNRNITAHSLRHSRATELLNDHNVSIEKIKDWLGHSDISTTMIYLHMSSKDDRELMGQIGGV